MKSWCTHTFLVDLGECSGLPFADGRRPVSREIRPLVLWLGAEHLPAVRLRRLRWKYEPIQNIRKLHHLLFFGRTTSIAGPQLFSFLFFFFDLLWLFTKHLITFKGLLGFHLADIFFSLLNCLFGVRWGINTNSIRIIISNIRRLSTENEIDVGPAETPYKPGPYENDPCGEANANCRAISCPYGIER